MPYYEYRCKKCGDIFDYKKSISDPHPTECEKCQGEIERYHSQPTTVQYKGKWFKTEGKY